VLKKRQKLICLCKLVKLKKKKTSTFEINTSPKCGYWFKLETPKGPLWGGDPEISMKTNKDFGRVNVEWLAVMQHNVCTPVGIYVSMYRTVTCIYMYPHSLQIYTH
jgi:hypothetical protein